MARSIVIALIIALLAIPPVATGVAAARPKCDGKVATIVGTWRSERIVGTAKRDIIVARGGNDKILGKGGNDVICAGSGKDVVKGGAGSDRIFGGKHDDTLRGGADWDRIYGGSGKDACYANAGGAKIVDCEEADLRVSVWGPATAEHHQRIEIRARVRNIGGKPAWFDLEVDQSDNAACSWTHQYVLPNQHVEPGHWLDYVFWYDGCAWHDSGPYLWVGVDVYPKTLDADATNDEDSHTVLITPPA